MPVAWPAILAMFRIFSLSTKIAESWAGQETQHRAQELIQNLAARPRICSRIRLTGMIWTICW